MLHKEFEDYVNNENVKINDGKIFKLRGDISMIFSCPEDSE